MGVSGYPLPHLGISELQLDARHGDACTKLHLKPTWTRTIIKNGGDRYVTRSYNSTSSIQKYGDDI
jgi:hypothetical protein